LAKGPEFYKNLARQIAQQEFPGDARSQSIYMQQIRQESHFNPNARSPAGAVGIAQFMPGTAAGMHVNPNNPAQALHGAARMDKANLKKYGNWQDVLSLYNSGKGWKQGQKIGETQHYVTSIMRGGTPIAGAGVDTTPQQARQIPSGGKRQALVASLLASNEEFARTGKVGALDPNAIRGAMEQVQTLKGAGRATFAADTNEPISPNSKGIIQLAKQYLGTPYKWGGANPKTGFDCSGFVQWLMARKGVKVGRTTYDQIKQGQPVGRKQLQPGDTVFFSKGGDVHHEGLYIGHGQFIHAPHTGDVIKISSLSDPYYSQQFAGGRRH
jgi:cell wall-associated NlpC family hydrolase